MRIGGGSARGRQLRVPSGRFRPTTSLVKQAMFSMLESSGVDWSRVLDLFAGSGALGIEALSRGASWSDFVEQERRSCALIKENLKKAGFLDRSHVYCSKVSQALAFLEEPYNIVFMDPPYSDTSLHKVLGQLAGSRVLGSQSLVAVAHSARFALLDEYDRLYRLKERHHGDTNISIYAPKGG